MDFFKPSEINFFKERLKTNRKYKKSVPQDVEDGKRIKTEIFNKTNHWAKTVAEKLNDEFKVIEDNRWNISGYFKEYSWARLFKKSLGDHKVYYTLGIHGDTGALCYKIDCQRDGSNKLNTQQVEQFDQKLKESNITWQEIYPEDLEKCNWESLSTKTVGFIKETSNIFDELNYLVAGRPESKSIKKPRPTTHPLNQILFGPPGTGKTYESKSMAVKIIDGRLADTRKKVNDRYSELYEKGQIQFVTFHQSTTYEDFVEGIKPVMSDEEEEMGNVLYKIEDGIFKKMCIQAAYEYIKFQEKSQPSSKTLTFSQLFDQISNDFQQSLDEGEKINIPLKSGNTISVTEISSQGNFILQHVDGQRTYTVSKSRLEKLFNETEDFDTIPNIYSYFRSIIGGSNASAYWAILNQIYKISKESRSVVNPTPNFEDKKRAFERIKWNQIDSKIEVPKYVLIIDEINRGNIAAVLGELITLLEEDKRGGKEESLDVTLPYSKSKFSVPPNLYIIGTMNTADRSVEALDTALRRRFSFQEIAPQPELLNGLIVEDVSVQPLLTIINRRIRKLLDKNHMIGHANFIKLSKEEASLDDLKNIFHNKLLPLLQEYFYGNFGKIQLVLGEAFVYDEENDPNKNEKGSQEPFSFAQNDGNLEEDYSDKTVYLIRDVFSMTNQEFKDALIKIYSPK